MDSGLTINEKSYITFHTNGNEDMKHVKTEILAIESFMIKQLYLMKTTLQKPNKSGQKNENVPYIAALSKQIEYLKRKHNKKLYNLFIENSNKQ